MTYTIRETREKFEHYAVGKDGKIIFSPHATKISNREATIKYYTTQMKVNMKKAHVYTYLKMYCKQNSPVVDRCCSCPHAETQFREQEP